MVFKLASVQLYDVAMTDSENAINSRLQPLGYQLENRKGGLFVKARFGLPFDRYFETKAELEDFISELLESNQWRLDFSDGGVDVDLKTGLITPHDRRAPYRAPYSIGVADMWGAASGGRHRRTDRASADFIQITSVERPPYGGNWYKARPPISGHFWDDE